MSALLVSNPPHADSPDYQAAASVLSGLTQAEVRMHANFPCPRVLQAGLENEQAQTLCDALRATGFSAFSTPLAQLTSVQSEGVFSAFEFVDSGLSLRGSGESSVMLSTSDEVYLVETLTLEAFNPSTMRLAHQKGNAPANFEFPEDFKTMSSQGRPEADLSVFGRDVQKFSPDASLDFYLQRDSGIVQLKLPVDKLRFEGLQERKAATTRGNINTFLTLVREKCPTVTVDSRPNGCVYTQAPVGGFSIEPLIPALGKSRVLEIELCSRLCALSFFCARGD